ncbi:hypothetical protein [Bosea sp. MMO-172]|uniref:hypothetical protein n=1 Tax=Bosea sp. MMO-172 TaxID=3127885 RepID=UPI003019FE15
MDKQEEQARRDRREAAKSRLRHALLNLSNATKPRHGNASGGEGETAPERAGAGPYKSGLRS